MPDIELKRLRELRHRADALLATLTSDLKPFQHERHLNGFRRKPDSESPPDDINVTTTCSCLMSLSLTGRLVEFYGEAGLETTKHIFHALLDAPWMSSGLAENNAFTTTLVLRLFGMLVDAGVFDGEKSPTEPEKRWESQIEFANFDKAAAVLLSTEPGFAKHLAGLFPPALQDCLRAHVENGTRCKNTEEKVVAELEKLIRTGNLCQAELVADLPPNPEILDREGRRTGEYSVPQRNRLYVHQLFGDEVLQPLKKLSLSAIARQMCRTADVASAKIDRFKINNYEPSTAVLYWFVDGISRARIPLAPEDWGRLCRFAADEFGRQRSRVVAKDAAMMDPVAMAMSACLCARLRTISKGLQFGTDNTHHSMLPSTVELESAVVDLFAEQTSSGIWPKYFPLFHYQDAGSNFCFTFELLEAILVEFGGEHNRLLTEEAVISGLERAVRSCEVNRLQTTESGKPDVYSGWNSGGNLETLRRGQPESWATAVVHMFLWELVDVLSCHIQRRLLQIYAAKKQPKESAGISGLLDIEVLLNRTGSPRSLKETLLSTVIQTFKSFPDEKAERLRKTKAKGRLSALLFGPPGTSKTEVAKAIAAELKWPLVEIDPSHFLQNSFQNIYVQAEKIFDDVMDMCGVVVLFDEMDALVQKRDGDHLPDTESKFLTTYMLPKLAKLHDRGRIVFLMATNFQANFDDAIKRAGRFDLLLCMGPPTLKDKCNSIHRFLGQKADQNTKLVGETIARLAGLDNDGWVEDQLSLYTYGDFKSFVGKIWQDLQKLQDYSPAEFRRLVEEDSQTVGLRIDSLGPLRLALKVKGGRLSDFDKIEFDESAVKARDVDLKNPAVKYMIDRYQSKLQ
ncbi:ATP-binding protein [Paludibaculum fermentans]|uniref:ATP-binding protein n=1 Tax=Paludibaculum fermentans TaxID=1473598 RepID=UPI003EB9931D